ncbi:MAG: dicarboxylate/amino acid:cation symporter [Gemmatimonadota bacterium]|nr:dicarboxylate/amino acid:cation symporter [Gemmatimonadota bacterium]
MSQIAILAGLVLGLALGVIASATGNETLIAIAEASAPFGAAFMRAIQMVVIPLVGVTVFVGVAKIGDPRKLGRLGGASVGFFWLTTLPAIVLGMIVMRVALAFAPPVTPPTVAAEVASELPGIVDFLVNLIPRNPFEAAAAGSLLPIIVFTVLFAAATTTLPADKREPLISLGESVSDVLIRLVHWVLLTAPLGVFGLAAPVAARTGIAMLQNLAVFIIAVVAGLFIFMAIIFLPAVRFVGKMPVGKFIKGTIGTYAMGFSTTSSVATLPVMFDDADRLGLSKETSNLVLPLAASINRPGSALFQGAAVIFLASVYDVSVTPAAIAGAVLATFLAAMTVAPVPSASIMTMAPALDTVGIPLSALGIMLGIDRVPDMFRSATNVVGHLASATVVESLAGGEEADLDGTPGVKPDS